MESKVKVFGHAVHPMLIPFPLGLLGMATIFDVVGTVADQRVLRQAADPMIAAGVLSGVQAGVFGAIDWLALPGETRAKDVATQHGAGNLGVLALFGLAWLLRRDRPASPSGLVLGLELAGLAGATVTSWLGGELVERHGVAVDAGAHLNAPSSLSDRPASEDAR